MSTPPCLLCAVASGDWLWSSCGAPHDECVLYVYCFPYTFQGHPQARGICSCRHAGGTGSCCLSLTPAKQHLCFSLTPRRVQACSTPNGTPETLRTTMTTLRIVPAHHPSIPALIIPAMQHPCCSQPVPEPLSPAGLQHSKWYTGDALERIHDPAHHTGPSPSHTCPAHTCHAASRLLTTPPSTPLPCRPASPQVYNRGTVDNIHNPTHHTGPSTFNTYPAYTCHTASTLLTTPP